MFLLALLNLSSVCDPRFLTFYWFLLNFTCRVWVVLCFSSLRVDLFCQCIVVLFPVGWFRCAASNFQQFGCGFVCCVFPKRDAAELNVPEAAAATLGTRLE